MGHTREQMQFIIHFIHNEKLVPNISEETCANALGYDLTVFRAIKTEFAEDVRRAARDLLADEQFAQTVDRLPFGPHDLVVGLGDSITDDYTSWCEILREVLAMRRPQDGIRVVNEGVSGNTTTEVIARFINVVRRDPDWVITMIGTNDARMHGLKPAKPMVSSEETEKNYHALRAYAQNQTHARWCWMTPTPVIPEKIAAHWFLSDEQVNWSNEELRTRAGFLLGMPDPVVDLQAAFNPLDPAWLLADGLHPSLEGQKVILRALVKKLANL
jgi:acyl-CoA thioesterase-1